MDLNSLWTIKGESMSDKSAIAEYGLTMEEIIIALQAQKLQFQVSYSFQNPYYKLLRREVEQYIVERYGAKHLETRKHQAELSGITKKLRSIKAEAKKLEKRKVELEAILGA